MGGGDFSAKRSTHAVGHTVDVVDTVGVGSKRSTHAVDAVNVGDGNHYL